MPAIRLRLLPLAAALVLLGACASTGTGAGKVSPPVDALYGQLDQASKGYETALQQAREGDNQASQQTLTAALDQLKGAAAHCGNTPGCDPQRFFSVFDRLLRLKNGGFFADDDSAVPIERTAEGSAGGKTGAASLSEAQRSVTLLRGQQLSELIAMNGPVKAALEMWLTQWRPNLMEAYVNYQYMRYQMWPEYQKQDLPEAVLFGIMAKESGGKVHAVSRSGAAGPLQFMYATGMRFGLVNDDGFDLRYDPAAAARANAEYLDEQLKIFNNNLELTLAAYNGGEGRMRRMVGDNTAVSFYDPKIYSQLSPETRAYVPAVLAAAWLFLHPDSYNLRFPKLDVSPGNITLKRPASVSELTVCLGSAGGMSNGWFRILRNLNPRLDPQMAQPAGTRLEVPKMLEKVYAVRCTDGPWPILANDLHTAVLPTVASAPVMPATVVKTSAPAKPRSYTVRRGDTLTSIVNKLGCSDVEEVAKMNSLRHHNISIGQSLRVPACR
ncbi:transglycosylase SLT domain-containing protein [Dyella tabacisoli]|uniref:LysM peptidoglycan-binding domain-containing protein n=1 Tax=Dyella tabacisoli TaxID=2282381 RepID=A0A369UTP9_9GAMM|nr:transglycosylase SLT domain-containing protein [Dyella tabacisoli]RDD83425.1 LysM peptidoglycan-binding domain-containing protein [Dyella tabacisoli]